MTKTRMRKWLWILPLGLVVVLLGVILIALHDDGPTRFDFLEGRKPYLIKTKPWNKGSRLIERPYTFKGDYETFVTEAERELRAKGWSRYSSDSLPADMRIYELERNAYHRDRVWFFKDMRYEHSEAGWLTVVTLHEETTLLERLRRTVGL